MPERIEVLTEGDVTVVQFNDEKIRDEALILQIGNELKEVVDTSDNKKLLLNFENVSILSSQMLGKLISLKKRTVQAECELKLCSIRPDLFQVFVMTGLNKPTKNGPPVFEIHDDQPAAMAAFAE